ncbi:MAG: glycosyltransferase [Candidatus Hodarchaeota archaeon]
MKETENLITICITSFNDSDFILNTLYCLEKITKNKYRVIIRDNNSRIKNFLKLKKGIQGYSDVELYRVENFNEYGSMAHGIALNDLVNKIDTKYGAILDADFTFLHKDWDEILINEINEDYPIIGAQMDPNTDTDKPLDFPCIIGIFFYTDILKKLKINFRPNFDDPKKIRDTAYQLKEKYIQNGYKGKLINYRFSLLHKNSHFRQLIVPDFYLDGYNNVFASHFARGSSLGKSKYLRTRLSNGKKGRLKNRYIVPVLGNYLVKRKGKKEKRKWIKICKNIVEMQV